MYSPIFNSITCILLVLSPSVTSLTNCSSLSKCVMWQLLGIFPFNPSSFLANSLVSSIYPFLSITIMPSSKEENILSNLAF